jgi:hypothetical protein
VSAYFKATDFVAFPKGPIATIVVFFPLCKRQFKGFIRFSLLKVVLTSLSDRQERPIYASSYLNLLCLAHQYRHLFQTLAGHTLPSCFSAILVPFYSPFMSLLFAPEGVKFGMETLAILAIGLPIAYLVGNFIAFLIIGFVEQKRSPQS